MGVYIGILQISEAAKLVANFSAVSPPNRQMEEISLLPNALPGSALPGNIRETDLLEEFYTAYNSSLWNSTAKDTCMAEMRKPVLPNHCGVFWDKIFCWPMTPYNSTAVLPCFAEYNGIIYDPNENATRYCGSEGTWVDKSDYSRCQEVKHSPTDPPSDLSSLIYLGGYSLSLAALTLAVFIFVYFKDLRCLRNTIHTNLMCTYIFAAFTWILNYVLQYSAQSDPTSCMVLVFFLHFFIVTNFFWMLVEGLYLYMLVVETFAAENIRLKVYVCIGWGAPAVFMTIWVITRLVVDIDLAAPTEFFELGMESAGMEVTGALKICVWMREHWCDWIFKAPEIAGLAINMFFLLRIMWVLITKLRSANTVETEQYRKATKALVVLIPLLGSTYMLLLIGPQYGWSGRIFSYSRAVLLSTQGFTVALFYCFLNAEVRYTVRHHAARWRSSRAVGAGGGRGGTRKPRCSNSKDWSPRSRTESIRLYSHSGAKRESAASETTTTTLLGPHRTSLAPIVTYTTETRMPVQEPLVTTLIDRKDELVMSV